MSFGSGTPIAGRAVVDILEHEEAHVCEECYEDHMEYDQSRAAEKWERTNSIDRRGILDAIDLLAEKDPAGREAWKNLKALGEAFG